MELLVVFVMIGDLIAYLPQIVRILRTKHAEDLSKFTWVLWTSTSIAQVIYYIYIGDIWLVASEGCCLLCNGMIFLLTLKYRDKVSQPPIKNN